MSISYKYKSFPTTRSEATGNANKYTTHPSEPRPNSTEENDDSSVNCIYRNKSVLQRTNETLMPSAAVRFFCVSHPPPTIVEPRKVNIFKELLNKNAARSRKHRFAVWWRCWSDGPFAGLRALLRSSKQILINEMLNNKRMAKTSPKTKTTITPSRNAHTFCRVAQETRLRSGSRSAYCWAEILWRRLVFFMSCWLGLGADR